MSIERLFHLSLQIWIKLIMDLRIRSLIKRGRILRWNLIVYDRRLWWLVWWRPILSWIGHNLLKWWISLSLHVGSWGWSVENRVRIMYRHLWLSIHCLVDKWLVSVRIHLRITWLISLHNLLTRNWWNCSSL